MKKLKKNAKKSITDLGKRIPAVRDLTRALLSTKRDRAYRRDCRTEHVDQRVVMFECYAGRGYTCSPRALYQAMLADPRFKDHTFVWVLRAKLARSLDLLGGYDVRGLDPGTATQDGLLRMFGIEALEELKRATIVPYASKEYYRQHARAGYWISNYILPTHMDVREAQTYLQTWHGTPLKRLGCDISEDKSNAMYLVRDIHDRYKTEGRRFSRLLSPSRFTTEKLMTAFDLADRGDEVVIEEGYPRNDYLLNVTTEQIEATRRRFSIPEGKRAILYAPTFRDNQHDSGTGYTLIPEVDFDLLQRELADDYVILFRPHYLVANKFNFARFDGFVRDVSTIMDINDLYVVSDILVTDYSSVFFDYANLGRPTIFYMYDLELYAKELRGFYLDLDELPGPIVRDERGFVAAIRSAGMPDEGLLETTRRFNERFTSLDDGRVSQRVLRRLFDDQAGTAKA
jgi:CDP-glycerol glycerophosphotransferase